MAGVCLHPAENTRRAITDADCLLCLQSNFKKYASGEGFVSAELAQRIVQAGPTAVYANGTNGTSKHHESDSSD